MNGIDVATDSTDINGSTIPTEKVTGRGMDQAGTAPEVAPPPVIDDMDITDEMVAADPRWGVVREEQAATAARFAAAPPVPPCPAWCDSQVCAGQTWDWENEDGGFGRYHEASVCDHDSHAHVFINMEETAAVDGSITQGPVYVGLTDTELLEHMSADQADAAAGHIRAAAQRVREIQAASGSAATHAAGVVQA